MIGDTDIYRYEGRLVGNKSLIPETYYYFDLVKLNYTTISNNVKISSNFIEYCHFKLSINKHSAE